MLLIDDNSLDRKIISDALTHAGFAVDQAADGRTGLRMLFDGHPDVVVLDVMMPDMDGWQVCARIREICETPIVMLTSLNREEDMIRGLDLGADDFVPKPVSARHLQARIRAILRRQGRAPGSEFVYDDGTLHIDARRHHVLLQGEEQALTPTEFRLLVTLAQSPGRVHTYAELLSAVWGPEYVDDLDFLRVYVWRLRKKLESGPDVASWIGTERGFGYRFVPRGEAAGQ